MNQAIIDRLDDGTVLRILQEATVELREELPEAAQAKVRTADEACKAVEQLLVAGSMPIVAVSIDTLSDPRIARTLLAHMLVNPHTRTIVEPLVLNPPADRQKTVELAVAGAVILGALIAWLQTTIEIDLSRKDGKLEFSFRLRKPGASDEIVKDTAKEVASMLNPGGSLLP